MKIKLTIFIFFVAIFQLAATETIVLDIEIISPESRENRELLESVLVRAAAGASRRYSDHISVFMKKEFKDRPQYELTVTAVIDEENPVLSVLFSKRGMEEGLSHALLGEINEDTHLYLSEVIFKLWTDMNPRMISRDSQLPRFLEEVPSQLIIETATPDFTGYNTASAVAVKENGNIVMAMGAICYEMNSDFEVVSPIADDLLKPNSSVFIYGAAVTPGGSVFLKPVTGRDIYKVIEGAGRTLKIRTGVDVTGPMAVLPNGVAIIHHTTSKKFVRIEGNRRSNIDIALGPYSSVFAMAAGPEGNIWVYDNMEQRFKAFADDGTFINSVIAVGTGGDTIYPMSMVVLKEGSILVYSNGALYKFSKEGILLWKMTSYQFREEETFPMTPLNLAVDEERGFIYLADYGSSRVMKFYDPSMGSGEPDDETAELLKLNGEIDRDPYSESVLWKKAEFYINKSSWVLARLWLEELLNENPFHNEANDMLAGIEINSLLTQAAKLEEQTLITARTIGPESARNQYSRTISLYEKILSLNRGDEEAALRMNRFREAYNREAADVISDEKPLTIASLSIEGIFPSLIHFYRDNPVGTVTVRNDLDSAVTNVRAALSLKQFIDFPVESEMIDKLNPGEEKTIDLKVLLNDKAFNLREDLPLLAQVSVSYESNGGSREVTKTGSATMYRRTALTWDDTAKLAAFIMPNESIVSAFSHRVIGDGPNIDGLPPKMLKAARISDALGTYGIAYVEDPDSPFSRIMGMEQHVDTVRYPRTTLHIRSGDCDDSTALLASLFESSGIATAIMTSPGHVFMAFDTEEPAANRWMFANEEQETVVHGGTVWIPLETTVLQEGFHEAWKTASRIINRHGEQEIDFVTVADQRQAFPPLPLGESNLIVVEPGREQIDNLNNRSLSDLNDSLFISNATELEESIDESSGRRKRQLSNRLAILYARFGEFNKAEGLFRSLINEESRYLSPYVNLGNLYYLRGEYESALEVLTAASQIRSDSVMVNLALAKTYYRLGDKSKTDTFFRLVENQSESLSEQYAYLSGNGAAVRAGIDEEPPIGWLAED